ncbi:VRR-NUC domain-containing protein [Thaumasiovibrio subtropicus]|uniref:VRR-NUC domain-containing protein n=1 Tax=Thaumasiovibrio subtropicus TaxID=1891207 RepID=UPI000B362782|nr:VRR-NUC domain-containing protein [Thaumasiovibrio subtropicus]
MMPVTTTSSPRVLPDLPVDYYLSNFLILLDTVSKRDRDLLSDTELAWIDGFYKLTKNAQCLLVRLLMRKGEWFREDKLRYDEVDIPVAIRVLEASGYVSCASRVPCELVLRMATKPELPSLFPEITLPKSASKGQWVEAVGIAYSRDQEIAYPLIRLINSELLSVLLLLFFGNSRQDLTQFVLSDLGIERFERYTLDKAGRLFESRQHIDDWLSLSELNDAYWDLVELKNRAGIVALSDFLPPQFDWSPLERKRARLANHIAREMERQGYVDAAIALFSQTTRPPSRERRARMLIKQQREADALPLLREMLLESHDEDEQEVALRILKPLAKKLPQADPLVLGYPEATQHFTPQQTALELDLKSQRVELAVAEHYQAQGWQVWFSENLLLNGLFGLAFWDIIFSAQKGAFLNPFQRAPYDMYRQEFIDKRQSHIDERLADVIAGDVDYLAVFEAKQGISNDWVAWQAIEKDLISHAIDVMPPVLLAKLFERLLVNVKQNRTGMPDLFMVRGDEWCWAEVKGPGDKLQNNQIRWCRWFEQHQVPYQVVYVTAQNDKKSERL